MGHGLDRRQIFRRGPLLREALAKRGMMRLTAHGDQRFEAGLPASLDIRRAEIAGVRQKRFDRALAFGQSLDLVQHRLELLLVVRRLDHIGRNDQQAPRGHYSLSVVGLLEAAARPPA